MYNGQYSCTGLLFTNETSDSFLITNNLSNVKSDNCPFMNEITHNRLYLGDRFSVHLISSWDSNWGRAFKGPRPRYCIPRPMCGIPRVSHFGHIQRDPKDLGAWPRCYVQFKPYPFLTLAGRYRTVPDVIQLTGEGSVPCHNLASHGAGVCDLGVDWPRSSGRREGGINCLTRTARTWDGYRTKKIDFKANKVTSFRLL